MDKFEFNYKIPGEINASMPPKAVDLFAEGICDVVVMFQTKLVCVFLQGHADRSCRQRLVGVIVAPDTVDGVQIGRGDGAVRFQTDSVFPALPCPVACPV